MKSQVDNLFYSYILVTVAVLVACIPFGVLGVLDEKDLLAVL